MPDNDTIKDGAGVNLSVATDLLSDSSKSPKVSLLDGTGSPSPINPARQGNLATYVSSASGYTAYATPQDMLTISGSATKIVRVINMRLLMQSTTGTLITLFFLKRSTANTGGTATNPTGIPLDSASAAATAVLNLYTAAPTPGTSLGTINYQQLLTAATTAAPSVFQLVALASLLNAQQTPNAFMQPLTLRGVAQSLCINFAGAALPAGSTFGYEVTWTESDT